MPQDGTKRAASVARGEREPATEYLPADRPGYLIQRFREAGAAAGREREVPHRTCAALRSDVSTRLHGFLQGFRIPTSHVERAGPESSLVRRVDPLPVMIRVWNSARDTFAERFGLQEGAALPLPVLEHYYLSARDGRVPVNESHAHAVFGLAPEVTRSMGRLAAKANAVLRSLLERRGLELVWLDLEFGMDGERVLVAGELSLRSLRCVELRSFRGPSPDPFHASCTDAHEAFLERVFLAGGD